MRNLFLTLFGTLIFTTTPSASKNTAENFTCSNWTTYESSCGDRFYICSDNFDSLEDEIEFVAMQDDVRC